MTIHAAGAAHQSNAEAAKQSGGMLALYPDAESARQLHVVGGEPLADLHCTLLYFGEDVGHLSSLSAQTWLDDAAHWLDAYEARAFAHATFNPDAEVGDPCAVYLIGNAPGLQELHHDITQDLMPIYGLTEQHTPWIPHVTAGYGLEAADLTFTGPIVFDRLVLKWMGAAYEYPLIAR